MKNNELKLGAILSYIILGLELAVGLFYTPILTRTLGQSEYGLYSLVASVISYLTVLDLGFGSAIVVYTARYRTNKQQEKEDQLHGMFLIIYTIIGIIAGIVGYILYLNVDKFFGNSMTLQEIEKAKVMMLILTANLVITFPMSIFSSTITAYEKFIFAKTVNIIRIIINPIVMLVLLHMGYKSVGIVVATTVLNIITLLINMLYCIKNLKMKFDFSKFDFKLLGEMFSFSFFIFLNVLADKANWSIDQFILGSIIGTVAVAIYNIATQFNIIYLSFSTAISGLLLPRATQMETKKATDEEFTDFFIKMGRVQYIIMALVITGFVLVGKEFILIWQGKDYIQSYYIACILMIPVTVPLIQNTGLSILQAKNKHKFRTVIFFIIAILNVAMSIPLARKYSGIGAAIGTAISLVIGQIIIMNIYYYKKIHIDIPRFWKEISKMSIPIVITFIIGLGLNRLIVAENYIVLLLKIVIYTLIYAVFVWKFAMNNYEKELFAKPLKQLKNKIKREPKKC